MADGKSLTRSGASLSDLEAAAVERLDDAEALLRTGRYAASIMSGFYSLEIRLKVIICRRLQVGNLPRIFETHDLGALILHAGLSRKIREVRRPREIVDHWGELLELSNNLDQLRYRSDPVTWDRNQAERALHLLRDAPNGVLPWLEKQASIKSR
jgi:hypothetical protein